MFGPKEKKERFLGERLHLKGERCQSPKCALVRKPYRPGMHGRGRPLTNISDFGRQLRSKQKFKLIYNLNERSLRRLFGTAEKKTGSAGIKLLELLERRLDNVLYRSGLAVSRSAASKLVVHGHILVNQKRVRSPGLEVKPNDLISIRLESKEKTSFRGLRDSLKKFEPPSWLAVDKEKLEVKVLENPQDLAPPPEINSLVEAFSK